MPLPSYSLYHQHRFYCCTTTIISVTMLPTPLSQYHRHSLYCNTTAAVSTIIVTPLTLAYHRCHLHPHTSASAIAAPPFPSLLLQYHHQCLNPLTSIVAEPHTKYSSLHTVPLLQPLGQHHITPLSNHPTVTTPLYLLHASSTLAHLRISPD